MRENFSGPEKKFHCKFNKRKSYKKMKVCEKNFYNVISIFCMIQEVEKCFQEYEECRPVKISKIRRENFSGPEKNSKLKIL